MRPLVLGFSGNIASGKSSLSTSVAEALSWPRVSFGDYVRAVARKRGFSESREVLQGVGESLINGGIEEFCRSVLAQAIWAPGQSLVIDGIRHIEVLNQLKSLVLPLPLYLILVLTDDSTRETRLQQKGIENLYILKEIEAHSTEIEVKTSLPSKADLIVDGTRPIEVLVNQIVAWVNQVSGNFEK